MKNDGVCRKCSRTEILRIPGEAGAFGSGNIIPTGMTVFSSVRVTRYVCAACGYVEEWVDSSVDRAKLRRKYKSRS